jgi:hypothetical protein
MTPLHLVSLMGDVVVAKVLFAYNPDVNALTTVPPSLRCNPLQ